MASLLDRRLLVVTGKGGTGKTTVASALGLLAARRGLRTIVVEVGNHRRLAELFAAHAASAGPTGAPPELAASLERQDSRIGETLELRENLHSVSIDPDRAMQEWLARLTGRLSARMLLASSTFQYFAAAAPGAKELVTMREVLALERSYELVVLDAPASGHALGMLRSPQTFSAIARVGPMVEQTRKVQELLEDPARSAYVAVAQASEMAVTETIELEDQLCALLGRDLDAVLVNGTLPQRFTRKEIAQLERIEAQIDGEQPAVREAVRSARSADERARFQRAQIARLRRRRPNGGTPGVIAIPFQFVAELDLTALESIAERLGRRL